jgi:WD40 repeat protein
MMIAWVAVTLLLGAAPGWSQSRVALVIGNGDYRHVPTLPNPINDARDVAASLGRLGFAVTEVENADFNAMRVALREFGRKARGVEMAVLYFAGHGMEIGGENFLIPIDAELQSDIDAEGEAIGLNSATLAVSGATRLGLVILDACRENPFANTMQRTTRQRAVARGLARTEPAHNVLVAYAAKDGTTADDGADRNSPFTAALLKNFETPGLEVNFLFRSVHDDVVQATRGRQTPFVYGQLSKEEIYLSALEKAPAPADPMSAARARWGGWVLTPDAAHSLPVPALALTVDGRRLASASLDMTVKVWDAESGRLLRTLAGHPEPWISVAFSRDGRRVAAGGAGATVEIWEVETGKKLQSLAQGSAPVTSIAFSLDGRQILAGTESVIRIWDLATGQIAHTLEGHTKPVLSVTLSRDSRRIVSAGADNTVRIWDAQTFKLLQTLEGHSAPVVAVALSPDGRTIASASMDKSVRIWDAESGKSERTLGIHSTSVFSIAFSRDGRRLASGSLDGTIKLWDLTAPKMVRAIKAHPGRPIDVAGIASGSFLGATSGDFSGVVTEAISWLVSGAVPGTYALAFSLDGTRLFSSGGDSTIRLWDIATAQLVRTFGANMDSVVSAVFSPDGRRIATGGLEKSVKVWDADALQLLRTLSGHSDVVTAIAFSPDGRKIASASFDTTIGVWSSDTGALEGTIEGHLGAVLSVAFSPDGRQIVSGGTDNVVRVWDADTLEPLGVLDGHHGPVMSVAFSPDGREIASGSFDRTVKVWDARTRKLLSSIEDEAEPVLSVAFSPDGGKIAATSSEAGVMKLWDASTGKLVATLADPEKGSPQELPNVFACVAFSPDGRHIAAGTAHRAIDVWDVETTRLVQRLDGHTSLVSGVSFAPDGRWIVSAGNFDNSVRLWNAGTGHLLSTLVSVGPSSGVALDADGLFASSPQAFEHLSLVRRLEAIEPPDDYKAAFAPARTLDEIAAAAR